MPTGRMTLFLLLAMCFSSFAWAVRHHFVCDRMSLLMRLTALFGFVLASFQAAAIFLAASPRSIPLAIGGLLYFLSLLTFWWAVRVTRSRRLSIAFSNDEPRYLLRTGPYRFVRHPFYLSYTLFWIAGLVAVPRWYFLAGVAAIFTSYYLAARMEEAKYANSSLAAAYQVYRAETGMFLPRFTERTSSGGGSDQLGVHHE